LNISVVRLNATSVVLSVVPHPEPMDLYHISVRPNDANVSATPPIAVNVSDVQELSAVPFVNLTANSTYVATAVAEIGSKRGPAVSVSFTTGKKLLGLISRLVSLLN